MFNGIVRPPHSTPCAPAGASAPPGYGKTTLAAQFAHQVTAPVAWLTLEDRHRDVALLHHEMLDTLQDTTPAIHDLPCPEPASPAERAACITQFLKAHLKQHVVLDDPLPLVYLVDGIPLKRPT